MDDNDGKHPSEFLEFSTIPSYPSKKSNEDFNSTKGATASTQQINIGHDEVSGSLSTSASGFGRNAAGAKNANDVERRMTFLTGIRLYPKAMAWSALLSATIIMEGYDTTLIANFFAFPVFRRDYGTFVPGHGYEISPTWQTALPNGATVGEILGLCLNGLLTDMFGYKKTVIGALIWLCAFISLAFFSHDLGMLMASTILCGLPWGIFQTLSTTYASEVMPTTLRAYLTSNVNMCWLLGQLISAGVIRGFIEDTSRWSYRIPFGLQWAFAAVILSALVFAPESPWWLIRHGRVADATKSLQRLTTKRGTDYNIEDAVALMIHTNDVEKHVKEGTSFLDCFRGNDLRRTEIVIMVWISQALCGGPLIGYATYFYEQAGIGTNGAFSFTTGMFGLAAIGNVISWFLMRVVGRRTLYMSGLAVCGTILLIIGCISYVPPTPSVSWALGSLVVILTFAFNITIGPVCYSLVSEIPSTRLRVKTVVIGRVMYNITCIITNVLAARMLNPTSWNWKGKTGFVFAGASYVCLLWCWFRLPEPKGLTYLELDLLFEKKADTKKFKAVQKQLEELGYFSVPALATSSEWRGYN